MYDDLLEAEREALTRSGRRVDKGALVRALREASGLEPGPARRAVEDFLARRDGRLDDRPRDSDWIDDLIEAERKAAARDDRPLTRALLVRAVREASALGPRAARAAVADYLRRKGGAGLPSGSGGWAWVVVLAMALIGAGVVVAWVVSRQGW